ncbi:RUN domain-containing protein 1 [Agrilus planipennis]|uniref:RUN domain-containing protein 1 n=1 Tax=Agrilus planipennis TaxID=224129 RepID=A0A1W4XBB1_AGRPL|nr:RUN domain-containing protein 1 [Agrilus planipennis]XP_018329626.1 RUN domain-containing protein 1 [Agrilus planipennis]XP_018329627.1 RUN domain-containing protein 1 [Agrilus planipennis]XP_018329628.1 RUN domain-containing protein 1 [Agrilus planipennis]
MDEVNFEEKQPTEQRWDPLGAADDSKNESEQRDENYDRCAEHTHCASLQRLHSLEEDHEFLNSSLFALTTHFAQVQFRLRQIVEAKPEDKEELLKSLEEFAFRGIPDIDLVKNHIDETNLAKVVRMHRVQQQELITKLKTQLHELERYAFENGEAEVPQDIVLERQRVILNELKNKMNLKIDERNYYQLTPADVKHQVDIAFGQLVNPLRMKEQLVMQLKTQVADLERFIDYLQADIKKPNKCACGCSLHNVKSTLRNDADGIVQRTASLLQMFVILQFDSQFRKNNLRNTMKGNHWGDLRARLELAVVKVLEMIRFHEDPKGYDNVELSPVNYSGELTRVIRKYLATSIRDLMQHGVVQSGLNQSLVPFISCFAKRSVTSASPVHAWEIIVEYYRLKNGEIYNSTPARKLSQSFNLDLDGSLATSNKQNLLAVIGNIISTHTLYKRSYDSHFKAFICAALNANKLVTWFNLILQCQPLISMYYMPWSYVVKTGFRDSFQTLDKLTKYKFDLPVDLAVHQFQNIKDIFT